MHLKKSALSGVRFRPEQKRFYPKRELAANVIGFVGTDDYGLAGIEQIYQKKLKGIVYSQPIEQDGRGRNIQNLGSLSRANLGNYDLMLTLDEVIQFIAEYHLTKQVEKYKADSGMAVVMDLIPVKFTLWQTCRNSIQITTINSLRKPGKIILS